MPDIQNIRPADLLIDEQNPRLLEPNEGQHRALQSLAEHLGPKLHSLAAHIVTNGMNPADLPIVTQLQDLPRYTVLEGNRRLAAIRALENPESIRGAASPTVLNKIRQLSRLYLDNPIEEIPCVVVRDREEARIWIELRHTGENDGAGLVPWGSDESGRFKSRSGASPLHIQALDFLQGHGSLNTDTRRRLPTTSFRRLLGSPAVRAKLGVESVAGALQLHATAPRVAKALMHVVNDLVSRAVKVRDIYTSEQRQAYAASLPADIVVAPTVATSQRQPAATSSPQNDKATSKRRTTTLRKRDRLIPSDCVLSIPSGRVRDIYGELRKLSLETYTNAVSVLFRVFVELSVDAYIDDDASLNLTSDDKLRKKIESISKALERKKKLNKQQARAIRSANSENSSIAPGTTTLNAYVHNEHVFPAPTDLRQHWSSLQPLLAAIWTPQ